MVFLKTDFWSVSYKTRNQSKPPKINQNHPQRAKTSQNHLQPVKTTQQPAKTTHNQPVSLKTRWTY